MSMTVDLVQTMDDLAVIIFHYIPRDNIGLVRLAGTCQAVYRLFRPLRWTVAILLDERYAMNARSWRRFVQILIDGESSHDES